ncbi:MAG: TIGR01212 family radical SAM protein [Odoribacteraceae bacterium]|jgi:radical SAM protein (TIGR01212 family)|nr:TIGR01212 family radical SAM protein [Odoribacteraceae bacterium]
MKPEITTRTSERRYRDHAAFSRAIFGERVQKLSIDGGFSCPNRDGSRGRGGCTFCNNRAFVPGYCRDEHGITRQLEEGVRFFERKYSGQKYLAYFQAYSGTHAPLEVLRERYGEALAHPLVAGLVIATRPDAVTRETLDYLGSLARDRYVCLEFGVESTRDDVLARVNRGHGVAEAERACRESARRGIFTGVHLILGLPGESRQEMIEGAARVSRWPVHLLKLHQLQIVKGTRMADEYRSRPGDFSLYSLEEYLDLVVDIVERVRPDLYLERFVNQTPEEYLVAPRWGVKNFEFTAMLERRMKERETRQGRYYKE